MELKPGVVLNNKYRVIRLVDEGGVGAVYEGRRIAGEGQVAIKVLKKKFAEDKEWIARFDRETLVASRVSSPRLARFIEVGEVAHRRFMVMEYLQGEKLSTRMERERKIAPLVMVDLAVQLLEALEIVHRSGVVHRGISPRTVFLQQMGRVDYVCLLDFGMCKDMTDHLRDLHTAQNRLLGSVAYAAPETMTGGSAKADARSDLFSVGVLLYRGISGLAPFPAMTPQELLERLREGPAEPLADVADVDGALNDIVNRALAYSPRARFQTAAELKKALEAWPKKKPAPPPREPIVRKSPGLHALVRGAAQAARDVETADLGDLGGLGDGHDTLTMTMNVEALADAEEDTRTITTEYEKKPAKLPTKTVRMATAPPLPQKRPRS